MKYLIIYRKNNTTAMKYVEKDAIRELIAKNNPTVLTWSDANKGVQLEDYVGDVLVIIDAQDIFDANLRIGNKR